MFYAPGLLYLHLPRTGGTFVADLLERERLGARQLSIDIGGHEGIRMIPERVSEQSLVFATMRDPWSWYASVDAHYRSKGRFDGFLHELFGRAVPFKEVIRALTCPRTSTCVRLDQKSRYPGGRVPEEGLPGQLAEAGVGLYTWLALRMFCREPFETVPDLVSVLEGASDLPWSVDAIIDTAQLREGLGLVLQAWNAELTASVVPKISASPAKNEKSRFRGVLPNGGPDPALYDQEMQEWVRKADGWLMHRLSFDLPVGSRRSSVTMMKARG